MKALLAAVLILLSTSLQAQSLSDIWWNPQESGWGLTTVHEGNAVAVTLYVHDAAHRPRWYAGALLRYGNTAAGDPEFLGDLFETDGTPIGAPWNPGDVSRRLVGRIFFRARPQGDAEIEYTIDGANVTRHIQRFTTQEDRAEGLHFATLMRRYEDCDSGYQGVQVDQGFLSIDRAPGAPGTPPRRLADFAFSSDGQFVCSFAGAFTRYGQSGGLRGQYACSDGSNGAVEFKNIEFNSFGFSARFTGESTRCRSFGGVLSAVRTTAH